MATTAWTYDEIEQALRLREREGLSWQSLSERTGQPVSRLRYVARKLAARDATRVAGFVEVVPSGRAHGNDPPMGAGRVTIELQNGIRLHVDRGIDSADLRDLIRAAGESC